MLFSLALFIVYYRNLCILCLFHCVTLVCWRILHWKIIIKACLCMLHTYICIYVWWICCIGNTEINIQAHFEADYFVRFRNDRKMQSCIQFKSYQISLLCRFHQMCEFVFDFKFIFKMNVYCTLCTALMIWLKNLFDQTAEILIFNLK